MHPEDIERISKLVGYVIFFIVFLGRKVFGRYLLKNYPNNYFIYLFYWKYIKIAWKTIFLLVIAILFILLLLTLKLDPPNAALISIAVGFLSIGFVASYLNKNIWKGNEKPTIEDSI